MPAKMENTLGLNAVAAISSTITNGTTNPGIRINQSGAGYGEYINQTGDYIAFLIGSTATTNTKYGLEVNTSAGARTAHFTQTQDEQCLNINKSGAGAGTAVNVANAGTGAAITTACTSTGSDLKLTGRATGSIGAGTEGELYYDTTLHKLRVRTAAGWETVTSV